MSERRLVSLVDALDFLTRCNSAAAQLKRTCQRIGNIEMPDGELSWGRAKTFHFYIEALDFYLRRATYMMRVIGEKEEYSDILETLFRGLIEVYCRILYVNNQNDDESLRRIIWHQIYSVGLSGRDVLKNRGARLAILLNYRILKSIRIDMPDILTIIDYVQNGLQEHPDKIKEKVLRKINQEMCFPSVRMSIFRYFDETAEPIMTKYFLYHRYSTLSEQIHGNFLLDYAGNRDRRFMVAAFLILIYLRFLSAVASRAHSESEISNLIEDYTIFKKEFASLLSFSLSLKN